MFLEVQCDVSFQVQVTYLKEHVTYLMKQINNDNDDDNNDDNNNDDNNNNDNNNEASQRRGKGSVAPGDLELV